MPDIREYKGFAYRQGLTAETPWLVSIVVPAEELLEWAGIPRRSEANLVGFQRAYDTDRVERAKEFFREPLNQSPTALVVGIHPQSVERGIVAVQMDDSTDEDQKIRSCTIRINITDAFDLQTAVEVVREQLSTRLQSDPGVADTAESAANESGEATTTWAQQTSDQLGEGLDDEEPEDEYDDDDGDDGDDGEEDAEYEIEMGHSLMEGLLRKLDDEDWCRDNEEHLKDMAKPATIIDGQHRVKGAQLLEQRLPFAVCCILECPWPEQVFQFTVVNYTAKGIPDQFITANAALSLTEAELSQLQSRLVQAGVKVVEYELMRAVHFDPRSPFAGMVNLSEKRDPERIGYKTMVRIAKEWYRGADQVFNLIFPSIYPDVKGRRKKTIRRELWKEEDWGDFFIDFWSVVRAAYESEASHVEGGTLWSVGRSQLMVAIVLYEYQRAFFRNLNAQDEEFFEVGDDEDVKAKMRLKLRRRAEKFTEYLPPDFFATKWAFTSLSTGAGRMALEEAMRELVDSKGQYQYARSSLVTGKTT